MAVAKLFEASPGVCVPVLEIVVGPAAGDEAVAAEHVGLVGAEFLEPCLAVGVALGALVQPHEGLDRVGMAPDVVEGVGRRAAKSGQPFAEPVFAAIDGVRDPVAAARRWLAARLR